MITHKWQFGWTAQRAFRAEGLPELHCLTHRGYGCVSCQRHHRSDMEMKLYMDHIMLQSKHGTYEVDSYWWVSGQWSAMDDSTIEKFLRCLGYSDPRYR